MITTARQIDLLEFQAAGTKFRIDRNAGIMFGVKLIGVHSENNGGKRKYQIDALERAVQLYEGAPVYIDHVIDPKDAAKVRGQREHWGEVRSVEVRPDGLYGDVHYLKSHHQTAEILERAERFPRRVGCSHSARAACEYRRGQELITDIVAVRSVDLVTQPATTKTLFESNHGGQTMLIQDVLAGLSDERRQLGTVKALQESIEVDPSIGKLTVDVQEADSAEAVRGCLSTAMVHVVESSSEDDAASRLRQLVGKKKEGGSKKTATTDVSESKVEQLLKRGEVREALAQFGLSRADIKPERMEILEALETSDEMVDEINSWPPMFRRPRGSKSAGDNPGSKLSQTLLEARQADEQMSYDDLKNELLPAKS